jgi:acyl-coenzyme A thioesterase 13
MNQSVEFYKQYIGQKITTAPSAFGNWLAGKILKVEEDSLSIEFEVRENMTNPVKTLHGGMIAAMMDEIIGMTIFVNGEKTFFYSINLNVDFISNVNVGTNVVVTSKIIKKSSRLIQAECVITGPDDKLLAKGSSNLISA